MLKKIEDYEKSQDEIEKQQKKVVDDGIDKLREELVNMLNEIHQQLTSKDGVENDLMLYQQKIYEKIDEIIEALLDQLADKTDTKRGLLYLEKKITELYLMINPDGKVGDSFQTMLQRRPLFQSCVSCDKELDQYQGRLEDYRNWKIFPPKETSPERMGRFGVGFAQMMQMRKQNIEKEKELVRQKDE